MNPQHTAPPTRRYGPRTLSTASPATRRSSSAPTGPVLDTGRVRSTDSEFEALRARLGDAPPTGLRTLPKVHLADLTDAINEARRRQREALAAAGDRALGHIPRLLRGPIRRVVG